MPQTLASSHTGTGTGDGAAATAADHGDGAPPMSAARQAALAREAARTRALEAERAAARAAAAAASSSSSPGASALAGAVGSPRAAMEEMERREREKDLPEREKHEFSLAVRRLIDQRIRRNVDYATAFACLKLLLTLITNVLQHPSEDKYRSFKASQKVIAKQVLEVPGGEELLIECGFRKRTIEMQAFWALPPANTSPHSHSLRGSTSASGSSGAGATSTPGPGLTRIGWTKLQLAAEALRARMEETQEQTERVQRNKAIEEEVEKSRKARALDEYYQDREARALKDERERKARVAHERQERERERESRAGGGEMEQDQTPLAASDDALGVERHIPGNHDGDEPPTYWSATRAAGEGHRLGGG